VRSAVFGQFN